ncbi:MAG TPA: carbon-nitrogen family hydrolase [Phycisphaerae bacterium]|nr:carbon-nitrogen family hydrolase [Phycisphaerae bacterium]
MRVLAIQFDIAWEDWGANFLSVSRMLDAEDVPGGSLVVLPEMFATGFSLDVEATSPAQAETETFLGELARKFGVFVCGGLAGGDRNGALQNQALLFGPEGQTIARYAKLHPFTLMEEQRVHAPGRDVVLSRVGDLTVSPLICYDLRFPEEFRLAVSRGAEVFLVLANWPAQRSDHWRTLLVARAIENQAYVVGVNRCGCDPNNDYAGGSLIVGPKGDVLAEGGREPQIIQAELNPASLRAYRKEFPVLKDLRRGNGANNTQIL